MKNSATKRLCALMIVVSMICGSGVTTGAVGTYAASTVGVSAYLSRAASFVLEKVKSPSVGSIGGEWAVLGLSRSGSALPDGYFEGYISRVGDYVVERKGILSSRKYTEYSRVILALTSLGVDCRSFRGYDLTLPLGDYESTIKQGINGAIFALLALDSGDYPMPENPDAKVQATRSMYVDLILSRQNSDGGWSVTSDDEKSDVDITAMALQSLADYVSREDVKKAVDAGFSYLSSVQLDDGGFESYGAENCESVSQVIITLCEYGKSIDDPDFVKKGSALDALKSFQTRDGGFLHTASAKSSNQMASEQALCALAALSRSGTSFYKMSDALTISDAERFPNRDPEVSKLSAGSAVSFTDLPANDADHTAITALSSRGIINGRGEGIFAPDDRMTRAEFCAIVVRALGLEVSGADAFDDVSASDWFFGYVGKAYQKGIVKGVGERIFDPRGAITREAAAVMVSRAAAICGFEVSVSKSAQRDILSQFPDYRKISDWAAEGLAFCYSSGILDENDLNVRPAEAITRREVAAMLYRLLSEAELL